MRNLDVKMGWRAMSHSGRWYMAAAAMFDETKVRVAVIQPLHENLQRTGLAAEAADEALLPLRLGCSYQELMADTALRLLHAAALSADGGKIGGYHRTIFPDGLNAETKFQSANQVARIDVILTKIDTRGWTDQPQLAEAVKRLRDARENLAAAVKARDDGVRVLDIARIALNQAREAFVTGYSTELGFIRMTYPDDAATREFFFEQEASPTKKNEDSTQNQTEPAKS